MIDYQPTPAHGAHELSEPATTQAKVQCPVCGGSVHNNPAALSYHAALHEPTAVHLAVRSG